MTLTSLTPVLSPPAGAIDLSPLVERLDRIEAALAVLVERGTVKQFYSTAEVAQLLGKAEFTVREWCRLGRIRAVKQTTGHGRSFFWAIAHEELTRIQSHGLLPHSLWQDNG